MNIKDFFAKQMFGITVAEAKESGICIDCRKQATEFINEISKREYEISALCQECQDSKYFTSK